MITFIRQADSIPGKLGEAVMFANEIAALSSSVIGSEVKVLTTVGGPAGMIGWLANFHDLGALGEAYGKLNTNADYLKVLTKAHGLFVDGTITDQIWHHG